MKNQAIPATSLFMATAKGQQSARTPVWFMRQAGRTLPEYRALRATAGSFLDLCYNPALASEVTLQPIQRFDMDAAILFADILLIPHSLGQKVWFVSGEGPRLDPVITADTIDLFRERNDPSVLDPVIETIKLTRAALAPDKALIGFAGAPWTVATYMLAGGPSKDPSALRLHYYRDQKFVLDLLDLLVETTVDYLIRQARAGVDAVQIFDSWAAGLPPPLLEVLCLEPTIRIAKAVKAAIPDLPVMMFPRGAGTTSGAKTGLEGFARLPDCDVIAIDTATSALWAKHHLSPHATVQGGLDPLLVVTGGAAMETAARHYLETFRDLPYIFNLGHGFVPETPLENVARLMEIIREG